MHEHVCICRAGRSHTHVPHVSHGTVKSLATSCDELINDLVYNIKNVN